ncbi:MAG: FCD domain-containing protein [Roseibium sp.]
METRSSAESGAGNGRAADNVVAALEAQIVSGQLKNREPLPAERELMEQFGTSRTVIREAISKLSSLGLVETRPRFRPIVRKPDYATVLNACGNVVQHLLADKTGIKNLYDSRVFVERTLVRDAAMSAQKDDILDLKTALEQNKKAISDSDEFFRTDIAFHGVLYRIPKNPIFPAIHEGYSSWLAPRWNNMLRSPERNEANYFAHKAILDAILERDPLAAEEALISHLSAAWDFVRDTFDWEDE